jgi:hypothetical protein
MIPSMEKPNYRKDYETVYELYPRSPVHIILERMAVGEPELEVVKGKCIYH